MSKGRSSNTATDNAVDLSKFYKSLVETISREFGKGDNESVEILIIPERKLNDGEDKRKLNDGEDTSLHVSNNTVVDGKFDKMRKLVQASFWETRKEPFLIIKKYKLWCISGLVFVGAVLIYCFAHDLYLSNFNFKHALFLTLWLIIRSLKPCIAIIIIVLCLALFISFIVCIWDFCPRKCGMNMTVFCKTMICDKQGVQKERWFVLVLSLREIPESRDRKDEDQCKNDKKRVGVVLDNFTAKKIGSDLLKSAGGLLVKLRDAINCACTSEEVGENKGYAVIQYHVNAEYLNYEYFRLVKDNLHVYPEPENPKIYREIRHWFLYTVNIEDSNSHC